MALSQLSKNVRRYHLLHAQRKEIEIELEALKVYFRAEAGEIDTVFAYRDMEVPVTWKEQCRWDGDKLQAKLGDEASACKKTVRYAEVSCRTAAKAAGAAWT